MAANAYLSEIQALCSPKAEQHKQASLLRVLYSRQSIGAEQRWGYFADLRQFVQQQHTLTTPELEDVLAFANYLCDWLLIHRLAKRFPQVKQHNMPLLAYADWKLGHWEQAYHSLQQQMFQQPNAHHIYQLYLDLLNYADLQGLPRFVRKELAPALSLEPLSEHHCQEFLWQYWDNQIPALCCLPTLSSEQDWFVWLHQQQAFGDQSTFAVLHQEWGFIGVVSLIVHANVGFFYYWIGKDFRAQGFGTQAASLLLALGTEYFGIHCCYAKVFAYNVSSQQAMKKLGFTLLPFNAAAPDENERLYYWGEAKSTKENAQEMAILLSKMSSKTRVNMPLSWQMELFPSICKSGSSHA